MSIKRAEFEAGLARIDPEAPSTLADDMYRLPGHADVTIVFKPLEPAVLGGLLQLPRARVVLLLDGLDDAERVRFVAYFDQTFQRGGG